MRTLPIGFHVFYQILFHSCHYYIGCQSCKCGDPTEFILEQLGQTEQPASIILSSSFVTDLQRVRSFARTANGPISFHNGSEKFSKPYDEAYQNFRWIIVISFPGHVDGAIEAINAVSRSNGKIEREFRWTPKLLVVLGENCRSGLKTCTAADLLAILSSSNTKSSISGDIFLVECQKESKSWFVSSLYRSIGNQNQPFKVQHLGNGELIWNHHVRKANFGGAELVTGVPRWGFLIKEEFSYNTDGNSTELTGGLAYHFLHYLQDSLNFTTKFLYADPSKPADIDSLHGFGNHLIHGITDFHLMKTTHLVSRKQNFTLLMPHFTDYLQAYFVQPPVSSVRNIYVEPFQANLWAAVVLIFVVLCLSFVLITSYRQHEQAKCIIGRDFGVLWTVSCMTVQGWYKDPDEFPTKAVYFIGSALGLVLSTAFSAAVVSALSVPQVAVKDFNGLISSQYKFTHMQESRTMRDLLAASDGRPSGDIPGQQLAEFRKQVVNVPDNLVGISMIFSSRTAFLSFLETFNTISKNRLNKSNEEICEKVSKVVVSERLVHSGMVLNKTSPLKEFFNSGLIQMMERGMLFKFKKDYLASFYGRCGKFRKRDDDAGLGMADVFSAFLFLGATEIIVFVLLAAENVYSKLHSNE